MDLDVYERMMSNLVNENQSKMILNISKNRKKLEYKK